MQKPQNNVQDQYPEFGLEDHRFDGYVDYNTVADYMKATHGIDFTVKQYVHGGVLHSLDSWLAKYMRKNGVYRNPREWVLIRVSLADALALPIAALGEKLHQALTLLAQEFGVELKFGFSKRRPGKLDPRYFTFEQVTLPADVKQEPEPTVRHKAYVLYDMVKPVPDSDGALLYSDVAKYMRKRFKLYMETEDFLRARRDQSHETMTQWFYDYWKRNGKTVKGTDSVSVTFELEPIMKLDYTKLRTCMKNGLIDCLIMEFGNKVTFKFPKDEYEALKVSCIPSGYGW